jgi:hypothetical protein
MLQDGQVEAVTGKLLEAAAQIKQAGETKPFALSDEFVQVFGNVKEAELSGQLCLGISDVDMVLGNFIVNQDDTWTLIDYEWCFEFPVPVHFLQYRMLHYYVESAGFRQCLDLESLYEKAGIRMEERAVYEQMERSFQQYIDGGHVPVRSLYETIGKPVIDAKKLCEREMLSLQVFYDRGAGCSEQDSYRTAGKLSCAQFELDIPVDEDVQMVRIDPMDSAGTVYLETLAWQGEVKTAQYTTNGRITGKQMIVFACEDPMILVPVTANKNRKLHVTLQAERMSLPMAEKLCEAMSQKTSVWKRKS